VRNYFGRAGRSGDARLLGKCHQSPEAAAPGAPRRISWTGQGLLRAPQWFAAEYLIPAGFASWDGVWAKQVQEWTVTLLGRYSDSYANNQFRALQQFFKWHATEDPDEQRPNPMASLKPSKIGDLGQDSVPAP
jgi:hypothetical protein